MLSIAYLNFGGYFQNPVRPSCRHWPKLRFGELTEQTGDNSQTFSLCVYLDGLGHEQLAVELVAEASEFGPRLVQPMAMEHALEGSEDSYLYRATVPPRPAGHFTPRIRVKDARLNLPLEDSHILWYR